MIIHIHTSVLEYKNFQITAIYIGHVDLDNGGQQALGHSHQRIIYKIDFHEISLNSRFKGNNSNKNGSFHDSIFTFTSYPVVNVSNNSNLNENIGSIFYIYTFQLNEFLIFS